MPTLNICAVTTPIFSIFILGILIMLQLIILGLYDNILMFWLFKKIAQILF